MLLRSYIVIYLIIWRVQLLDQRGELLLSFEFRQLFDVAFRKFAYPLSLKHGDCTLLAFEQVFVSTQAAQNALKLRIKCLPGRFEEPFPSFC